MEVLQGDARITSPWTVEVNGQTLTTRAIVIATGARPAVPEIPGLDTVCYYTSDTIWSLTERPERLVVLGGGPIGCELAQAFARLGCQVTQVERGDLMMREDTDAVALVKAALQDDGVRILMQVEAVRCEAEDGTQRLIVRHEDGDEEALSAGCRVRKVLAWKRLAFRLRQNGQLKPMPGYRQFILISTHAAT